MILDTRTLGLSVNVLIETVDSKSGEVINAERVHNLVVTSGRNLVRDLIYVSTTTPVTHFGVGTSSTAVAATDTALIAQVLRDTITQFTANSAQLVIAYYLPSTSANGNTLREAGLFNASSGGTMFARITHADIVKTNSIAVNYSWTINITAS